MLNLVLTSSTILIWEECLPDGVLEEMEGPNPQKAIEALDFTNRLRLAWVDPRAAKIVHRLYGLRGVPLGWGRTDTGDLFESPFQIHSHQISALEWMRKRELTNQYGLRGGLLCLWMGLGKSLCSTLQILCYKESNFPSLIVTSLTLLYSWKSSNFDRFFGNRLKILYFHKDFLGENAIHQITRSTILKYDIVITTYDVVNLAAKSTDYHTRGFEYSSGKQTKLTSIHLPTYEMADMPKVKGLGIIYGTPWERVVCDETQTFANPETNTFKSIMGIYGRYKWCLSGTPIRNYDIDIWSQLRFCGYEGVDRPRVWKTRGLSYMKEHNLRSAILRMTYKDAGIDLPPLEEKEYIVSLSEKERDIYNRVMKAVQNSYDEMMLNKKFSFANVLAQFTRLRQASISPYLVVGKETKELPPDSKLSKWCTNIKLSGYSATKVKKIIEIISNIPKDEKVLIFSMFVKCLDLKCYFLCHYNIY
jgi:SNF2 family DNA or RNA helicase